MENKDLIAKINSQIIDESTKLLHEIEGLEVASFADEKGSVVDHLSVERTNNVSTYLQCRRIA